MAIPCHDVLVAGMGRRRITACACLCALGLVAIGALAGTALAGSLSGSGTLTYAFQASPELGCEADDLCGVTGALALAIGGSNDGQVSYKGPSVLLVGLAPTLTSRDAADGTTCTDVPGSEPYGSTGDTGPSVGSFTLAEPSKDGVTVEHPQLAAGVPDGGRCAGPLESDLVRLPITVTRTGATADPSFSLALSGTTTSGPFTLQGSGNAQLTPGPGGFTGVSFGGPEGPGRGEPFTYEQATLDATPQASTAPLTMNFQAGGGAFCTPLAACGTTGTIAVSIPGAPRPVRLTLTRVKFRHASPADGLAALKAGDLEGGGSGPVTVQVSETVMRDGAIICHSTRTETLTATYVTTTRKGELITIAGSDGGFIDFDEEDELRTYCPGPTDGEDLTDSHPNLFSENQEAIAQGVVPLRGLTGTHASAGIARTGSFSTKEYSGSWNGTLSFPLRFTHLAITVRHGGYHEPVVDELP